MVPNEKDAADFLTDLQTAFADRVETYLLPWWGLVPYRSAARGSAVFGARSGVLAKLALPRTTVTMQTKPRLFIVTQRSLQSPVPAPDYVRSLVFSVYKGEEIDPTELSEKLTALGYIRVPKTTVHGEFTLRGEVLDIFTPGESLATRIVFDFDAIEQIKSFDPETQTTVAPLDNLLIYPMKEVIWTDDFVAKVESYLTKLENGDDDTPPLVLTEAAKKAKEKLLDELRLNRESEGEELFYPALWEKRYSVLDYLPQMTDFTENDQGSFLLIESQVPHESVELQAPDFVPVKKVTDKGPLEEWKDDYGCISTNTAMYRLVEKWIEYLKQNECYNNTRIILVADHGVGLSGNPDNFFTEDAELSFNPDHNHPLLLVKDFTDETSKNEFRTDSSFMTNADVPSLAFSGIIENPINPFTNNPIVKHSQKEAYGVCSDGMYDPGKNGTYAYTFKNGTLFNVTDDMSKYSNWKGER